MNLTYKRANKDDADRLISIYNASFYDDYIKYGKCPAYGKTRKTMEESIEKFHKLIIYHEDLPIGVISVEDRGNGEYYLGCLCVIPEYQGKGIGTQAINFMLEYYADWNKITLVTPEDKTKNIDFYTKKCGFRVNSKEIDDMVTVVCFRMER